MDEPSSALDPIAERNLFKTFMQLRKGRTVIFVTHRFKHLVDHADLILFVFIPSTARRLAHIHLGVWQMERLWSAGLMPSSSRQAANTRDYTMPKSKVLISNSSVGDKTIPSPKLVLNFFAPYSYPRIIIIALYIYTYESDSVNNEVDKSADQFHRCQVASSGTFRFDTHPVTPVTARQRRNA